MHSNPSRNALSGESRSLIEKNNIIAIRTSLYYNDPLPSTRGEGDPNLTSLLFLSSNNGGQRVLSFKPVTSPWIMQKI